MKEKLKAIFDAKPTWAAIAYMGGSLFGEPGRALVDGVGLFVMALL